MRIVVSIVSGVLLAVWRMLIQLFGIINFLWTLISGKRVREFAELLEIWNTQIYIFLRYMTFVTNKGPSPFTSLESNISKYQK